VTLTSNTKTKQSQADQSGRIDFAKGVPEVLFRRADGKCSVPRCKNPAMGPFESDYTAVNMGMACHIFSAAANGPRGREGKTAEFISSAENGIWCCHYHGTLIDKAKGKDYSAETLLAWKNLAEARVLKRMNDIPSPLGWVDSIEFTEFAWREGLPKIELSRNTLLLGENGAGKSVLMEVAASVSNAKFGERFFGTTMKSATGSTESAIFAANVTYSTVDSHGKKINIEVRNDTLTRTEGVVPCLLPPGDIEIILASDRVRRRQDNEDDVDFMVMLLDIDKTALYSLAKLGTKSVMPGEIEFSQAFDEDDEGEVFPRRKENGEPYIELLFRETGKKHRETFSGLSGSEQVRVIVDLFISKAREVCKQRLTLLMIDDIISGFDDYNYSNLLSKLTEENFQSVVMLPPGRRKEVLEYINEVPQLRNMDYLKPWRLVVVDALDSLQRRARRLKS
jgi:ABC-type lipoprotein export system ATPase subunit